MCIRDREKGYLITKKEFNLMKQGVYFVNNARGALVLSLIHIQMCIRDSDYTKDVMEIMTGIRKEWGLVYPEERK